MIRRFFSVQETYQKKMSFWSRKNILRIIEWYYSSAFSKSNSYLGTFVGVVLGSYDGIRVGSVLQ